MTSPTPVAGRFDGAVALVVGAAHGIGRACAHRLAAEGARVAVADLDHDVAVTVTDALPGAGHLAVTLDVTDRASVDAAVADVVARAGTLDLLVHVAGADSAHPAFEETDDDVWRAMLDLNLVGTARTCRAAVPHLRRSTWGPAIVTTSSVNALLALGSEPYSAAKAGLSSLTQNLAATLGPEGIRINTVAPGTIRTRNWDNQPGGADRLRGLYPLGRVGEPEDVAAAVAFLASHDAAWITGVTLPIDGGLLTGPGLIPGDERT
ncbi:short-chain dehydrogenase/reductase SDR [Beutenbergia cavernae DSM 12333]|uniref:Short-chain dehydrogenase/reductase SDR n=1 Tax=Beutenbergia cavernae (strain ATCC BAA-8 / DSM 12333 / CCUG 43141 / JCM 11478 / NBRC 16432 / NCIMB 13614 / HKI 0122) TaxID=471853 RepID=C5C1E2_BEUC1|nr:SDR family oxidoreductase [Beutenbergia cavernae]ACQ81552.1 short-chain dehydrogenase/reductase SDR [Beutenbergia cavernae DSM 12333]